MDKQQEWAQVVTDALKENAEQHAKVAETLKLVSQLLDVIAQRVAVLEGARNGN